MESTFSLTTRSGMSTSTDGAPATNSNDTSGTQTTNGTTAVDVETDNVEFYELFNHLGFSESNDSWQTPEQWLAEDANDPGYWLLLDDEIVAMIRSNEDDSGDESGSDIESQPHEEACNAFPQL